ncbi:tRNA pseudouridine(13) synthase TruD [Poseidonibacter ostreae]|mgnify:FL=1|uniref:tRNA pseudouridine synthase D n=1 Tax=Poseidonibacter ostreae TaxID=2654171 RepID=A0A6L4WU76_9BACT|nr:tRNA pseudouridine(13) synthase TruD [Poseidonibacter ostreae]KAB7884164.1 tRNA pseudouridine(13) synthase TruD [Poseidonibacter ostreae]KAB7889901.1 tRNA pseudouridine(13) synthase TruD [Poseidonibacter ostreae]KAB7890222.1 tRNA pseudouridine(13) synthase TruD [Poseidonibacter ostreae]MAC82978.1 tRNA pseudouridine(13) synthase TruD [Arcobacter sp.]
MKQLQRYLNHSKIDVLFKQNKDDFVVTEIPLYEFSGEGEHLILKIRKKDLATWDALEIIAKFVGCKSRDIGYAGLKDKNAMTVQTISIHKQYEEKLKTFNHPNIKILETTYHNNKIKVGHLKGNKFFIRLKRVNVLDSRKIEAALGSIVSLGMPNYFGFQRFGIEGDNYKKGKAIIEGTLKEKRRNLKQMYINAYQSYLFNSWLSKRIEISKLVDAFEPKEICEKLNLPLDVVKRMKKQKHPLKLITGDLLSHYPFGKIFTIEDLETESDKFYDRDRVPTGLLSGKRVKTSVDLAYEIEKEYEAPTGEDGARRFAWIFPDEVESNYKEDKNWMELKFTLPKGCYATELIAEIIH